MRRHGSGVMVQRKGTPRWTYDTVRRLEGRHQQKVNKVESPSEVSLTGVGAVWGDRKLTT